MHSDLKRPLDATTILNGNPATLPITTAENGLIDAEENFQTSQIVAASMIVIRPWCSA
jgi:hypothetical protein